MESEVPEDVLHNIKEYAETARKHQGDAMELDDQNSDAVQARLTSTINDLKKRLEQRQSELNRLKAKALVSAPIAPSADPRERLKQLRAIKAAYGRMTPEAPNLPEPRSALQPLLAARVIQKTIKESKENITSAQSRLESAEHHFAQEENQLSDAKQLSDALQERTVRLQQTQRENLTKTSAEKAKELVKVRTKRKQAFERDTEKLRDVLNGFISEHLAAMLAAEEIGGPVVGELMDVDEDMLTAGFSAQGKPKSTSKSVSDTKRQRRIDEIWGVEGSQVQQHQSEKDAAGEEVLSLLEKLITTGGYIELQRDSAVARFLVRAKVAQFHPKDARKLRVVDFARELDE